MKKIASIEQGLSDLKQGKMVILCDDECRENEGDLIMPAEYVTPEAINFMSRQACGLICLSLTAEDFARLQIPMMTVRNQTPYKTAFGVSFEAARGVSTGISAFDRAHSISVAVHPESKAEDIIMPGHVFPLKGRKGGIFERPGHTEGSLDLMRLAGLKQAAVVCEVIKPDGEMARLPDLLEFAHTHDLAILTIKDLLDYRLKHDSIEASTPSTFLPLDLGDFEIKSFLDKRDQREHIALISKKIPPHHSPLIRIHSECITGDVFGSSRCDCGPQLKTALSKIAEEGGVLLYLRQEGRGIGLANKLKAYALQDQGLDTVEANHQLGFVTDARDYGMAAQILHQLNINQIRLLTNNPHKIASLKQYGIVVKERIPLEIPPSAQNKKYLLTKKEKMGHFLELRNEN